MVQYDVLKERWKSKLLETLSKHESSTAELKNYLHPAYFVGDINIEQNPVEESSLEKQQLIFLKIEAQVYIN